jgi:hypothetical protein
MSAYMRSAPPQNYPPTSSDASIQRKLSKKSSFLSLKKEKRPTEPVVSPTPSENGSSLGQSHFGTPPSSYTLDSEIPLRPVISRPTELKSHRSRSGSKSAGSSKEAKAPASKGREKSRQQPRSPAEPVPAFADSSIPWPASDDVESLHQSRRRRTLSGPSNSKKQHQQPWEQQAHLSRPLKYPYRDSGSSTLSQFEPLPQTPVDDYMFSQRSFSILPVVVAAPIAGVETMDALVEGMNGSSEDDHYGDSGPSSGRGHLKKTGFHPLYHPPLPKPPPGVTLGVPRKSKRHSDSDSEGNDKRNSFEYPRNESQKSSSRSRGGHLPSSITVTRFPTFDMPIVSSSSSQTSFTSTGDTISLAESVSDYLPTARTTSPPLLRPSTAPTIDEIIKTHAPQVAKATLSRRTSWISQKTSMTHDEPSQPMSPPPPPAMMDSDADLVSRSSVDTIAEEIRQTMRNQFTSAVTSPVDVIQPRVFKVGPRPRSSGAATDPTRSPLSEGRRNSSLFDSSTVSDQTPLPPMDISRLTKAPIHFATQTIAQYLRSSRLTTMLKLTRSPHASREYPLNVSLSDLGSPTGLPLLVFLGLGCVRHIMGLYDEMAELLGVRLITIDRYVHQYLTV